MTPMLPITPIGCKGRGQTMTKRHPDRGPRLSEQPKEDYQKDCIRLANPLKQAQADAGDFLLSERVETLYIVVP